MYTSTAAATGTDSAISTVLSVTWPDASTDPLPGGRPGPRTNTTSAVPITLTTSHHRTMRRKWLGSLTSDKPSDHLDEAVHVADGLHGTAEAVDETGGARHEALPAVQALDAGSERERDRLVVRAERAGRVVARILRVVGNAVERHRHAHLGDREDVGSRVRVDRLGGLAVQQERAPDDSLSLADERITEPGLAVELVDR